MARDVLLAAALFSVLLGCVSSPSDKTDSATRSDAGRHTASRHQTRCPVMGGPIDKGLYVDVKGKRIYLCCAACEEAVRTEPEKYIEKIERRGETVEESPLLP